MNMRLKNFIPAKVLTGSRLTFQLALFLLPMTNLLAITKNTRKAQNLNFPIPEIVQKQVTFWEKIFYNYPSHAVIIHDTHFPSYIIDIIDFRLLATQKKKRIPSRAARDRITKSYIDRYNLALKRFRRMGKIAIRFGPIERRIFNVYKRERASLERLYHHPIKIRGQGGLADEFITAANRAQQYLPYMEAIFKKAGLPVEITRLAFVESMFNLKAKSKVGASGVWQFMPGTAKQFMHINKLVDERNAPLKATVGAAKLIKQNYRSLKSWPLAITAYNHGKGGMLKAVRRVGSRRIGDIIKLYRSSSFGYASRNFYSEFIAASKTYNKLLSEGVVKKPINPPKPVALVLPKRLSVAQILKFTPLNKATLAKYNSCLRKNAFRQYRFKKLPKNYRIFVPKHLSRKVASSLNKISRLKYAKRH